MRRRTLHISRRAQANLKAPARRGARHTQATSLAMSLLRKGLCPDAVRVQLRSMYAEHDFPDAEINGIISWAVRRLDRDATSQGPATPNYGYTAPVAIPSPEQAVANAETWLNGFRCQEQDLRNKTTWPLHENPLGQTLPFVSLSYDEHEQIAIVTNLRGGPDVIFERGVWYERIRLNGVPSSDEGAWIRLNPVRGASGTNGTVCDDDVVAHRYVLLETDVLPPDLQLSMLARLPLPIFAIVTSGGKSHHAWIKVDCRDAATYRDTAAQLLRVLAPFGFDQNNRNPGRAARLPGAIRQRWTKSEPEPPNRDPRQRLLYLNPSPTQKPIIA